MLTLLSLAGGTLISEDLACITAGVLIQRGDISATGGVLACTLGIFAGDVGLWALGRMCGWAAFECSWIARRLSGARRDDLRAWLDRHAGRAIVVSRFLPGTRLPLYVIAGFSGLPAVVFAQWALLATMAWTPALVLLTASFGQAFVGRVAPMLGSVWAANIGAAALLVAALRTVRSAVQWHG